MKTWQPELLTFCGISSNSSLPSSVASYSVRLAKKPDLLVSFSPPLSSSVCLSVYLSLVPVLAAKSITTPRDYTEAAEIWPMALLLLLLVVVVVFTEAAERWPMPLLLLLLL
jgi:hypothetical protein